MSQTHDKGLEFRGRLPLAVQPLAALPEAHELLAVNHGNEQVLRSVMMLDERPDQDDSDPLYQELKRQDQKINLVLELLSTLLMRFDAIPAAQDIQLTAADLLLRDAAPELAGACAVQLYIEPGLPRPLHLYGVVDSAPVDGCTRIVFHGISRGLSDLLDKFLFRFHRRLVASAVAGSKQAADR